MHHAHVLLGAANVARVFERNPGVAGFKQHGENFSPQLGRFHGFEQFQIATRGFFFVAHIGFLEGFAVQVVQIWAIGWAEQGPVTAFHHTLHEQVGNPVRGVHVVGAAAIIASVLAQFQEFFNVQVPCFQVSTHRAFALAALVHGNSCVVHHFQEWHHTL